MQNDSKLARATRLREARQAAGFHSAAAAAEAMGIPAPTYASHENGHGGMRADVALRYARKFKVSPEWLLTGRGESPALDSSNLADSVSDVSLRPLVGTVQAGVWQEPFDTEAHDLIQIPIPADRIVPGAQQYWFEVVGDSVDQYVGPGGRIFCINVWDWARDHGDLIRRAEGKLVIAERRRSDGTFQRTCKRLSTTSGAAALHTASNSRRWKNEAPIALNENGDTVEVTIVAVVTDLLTVAP